TEHGWELRSRWEGEQGVDGPIGTVLNRLRDLRGECPESPTAQQVCGLRHIPAVPGSGGEWLKARRHEGSPSVVRRYDPRSRISVGRYLVRARGPPEEFPASTQNASHHLRGPSGSTGDDGP